MKAFLSQTAASLLHLFFPDRCAGCDQSLSGGEQLLCIQCLHDLPETRFHLIDDNPVEKIFAGRIPCRAATACYFFHKGSVLQNIIHQFKYHDRTDVARYMGNQMGHMLRRSASFASADCLVPVPLSLKKEKQRTYNQAYLLCKGMEEILHLPVIRDAVTRVHHTESQTHKSRLDRWENVKEAFRAGRPKQIQGRHLLLVDDVITTGATLEACAQTLLRVPGVTISIAALAIAQH